MRVLGVAGPSWTWGGLFPSRGLTGHLQMTRTGQTVPARLRGDLSAPGSAARGRGPFINREVVRPTVRDMALQSEPFGFQAL